MELGVELELGKNLTCLNLFSVSNTRDKMTFRWMGPNAIEDSEESGSMALSPVLKNHNAYLVHNETLYCDKSELWRGMYIHLKFILRIALHFVKEITAV